jgi:hypothetical protein
MALRLSAQQVTAIGQNPCRRKNEIGEARVPWPDHAPQQTEKDQTADAIAGPGMQVRHLAFAAQVRHCEARDQRPVKYPHQRVPHDNLAVW